METRDQEKLDRWLDRALGEMSNAEPRAGLENRVLARVREEREVRAGRWHWWVLSIATAAVVFAVAVFLIQTRSRVETMGRRNIGGGGLSETSRRDAGATPLTARQDTGATTNAVGHGRARGGRREAGTTRPELTARRDGAGTKLDQFPSPTPLSEQELMLARYVRDFGDKAVLVARAQTESRRRDEAEFRADSNNER